MRLRLRWWQRLPSKAAPGPKGDRFPAYCDISCWGHRSCGWSVLGHWPRTALTESRLWCEPGTVRRLYERSKLFPKRPETKTRFATSEDDFSSTLVGPAMRWRHSLKRPRRSPSPCAKIRGAGGRERRRAAGTARKRGRSCWAPIRLKSPSHAATVRSPRIAQFKWVSSKRQRKSSPI